MTHAALPSAFAGLAPIDRVRMLTASSGADDAQAAQDARDLLAAIGAHVLFGDRAGLPFTLPELREVGISMLSEQASRIAADVAASDWKRGPADPVAAMSPYQKIDAMQAATDEEGNEFAADLMERMAAHILAHGGSSPAEADALRDEAEALLADHLARAAA